MIEFGCKKCGKKLSVQDQYSGKRVKCPKCGSVRIVPDNLDKIKFNCQNCGQRISVLKTYTGKKGKCPKCNNIVVVPIPKVFPAKNTSMVSFTCPMCDKALQIPETLIGKTVRCPECGSNIETDENLCEKETEEYEKSEGMNRRLTKVGSLALKAFSVPFFAASSFFFINSGFLGDIIGRALKIIGCKLFRRGKQYAVRVDAEKAHEDPRAPVLYLRAFKDDEMMSKALGQTSGSFYTDHWEIVTQEERLAKAVKPIGPFLAIGRPWEKLPTLGATRYYIHGENWREEVLNMLKGARLVIIRAAATQSLMWELKVAKKYLRPEQLVLLVPLDREAYEAFRSQARKFFPYELPVVFSANGLDSQKKSAQSDKKWGDHGIITFDVKWKPNFSPLYSWPWKKGFLRRGPYLAPYAYGLYPVYMQLGVDWREPLNWKSTIAIFSLLVMFLALMLLGIISGIANSRS